MMRSITTVYVSQGMRAFKYFHCFFLLIDIECIFKELSLKIKIFLNFFKSFVLIPWSDSPPKSAYENWQFSVDRKSITGFKLPIVDADFEKSILDGASQ